MTTPNLALPELIAAQAQKHVTVNEALRALDALVQLAVLDRDLSAPPGSPNEGQRWLVASGASGAWAGHAQHIAAWQDGDWEFYAPQAGWLVYVSDEGALLAFTGSAWVDAISALTSLNNMTLLGVGTTADATNPFSAKLNNILWAAKTVAEGGNGDLRWTMSKESAADTLSMLLQTASSGRAELGLAGDDDFHVKVSADGAGWKEALTVDRATGGVRFLAHSSDLASAATCDIGNAPSLKLRITGTTAISSFGSAANAIRLLRFAGALTLTHNATSLVLPGGATIVTAADDTAIAVSDSSGNWRVWHYQRAGGFPLLPALPASTTDNQALRSDGSGGNVQGSAVTISDTGAVTAPGGIVSAVVSMVDDSAAVLAAPGAGGMLMVTNNSTPGPTRPFGIVIFRATGATITPTALAWNDATNIAYTTGVLGGTTGADGKLTFSCNGDGNVYVENRLGATVTFRFTFIS